MFDENDKLPDDEEEILVYVEFDGSVGSNALNNEKLQLDMIGLDTEHPIMQVNGKFYEGNFQDAVGTYMFFEKDKNPKVDDPVFDVIPTLKYLAKTRKILKMNRIFVELKTEMLGDSNEPECTPSMDIIKKAGIPPRYREEALNNWEKVREDRLKALNDYLEKQRIRDEKRSQGIEPDSASDEDNPFAIYKNEEKQKRTNHLEECSDDLADDKNEKSEIIETDDKKDEPNVIDPGPSTSKDSTPWKSPSIDQNKEENREMLDSQENIYHVNLPNVKGKHHATIQVTKRAKIRKCGKIAVKKITKLSENPQMEENTENSQDEKINAHNNDVDEKTEKMEETEMSELDSTVSLEKLETLTISPDTSTKVDTPEFSENNLDENKKKLEKQQKREEKMRLLTDKLKKAANERRLKNQDLSEDPV